MTPEEIKLNLITEFAFEEATSTTDGFKFTMPHTDENVTVLIANTSADTAYDITLKKPATGGYAASSGDVKVELAAGEYAAIKIESARFANNDGTVILIPENAAVKAAVLY